MRLQVVIPTRVVLDDEADIVIADGVGGSFGLLPHHVDYVTVLAVGLVSYRKGEREAFIGVDGGLLVKRGDWVRVATPRATEPAELGRVEHAVRESFEKRSAQEERAIRALDRLEADMVRRIAEMEREHER